MPTSIAQLLDSLSLGAVLRSASHREVLAAADIVNGLDTARSITIRPLGGHDELVVVTRIQAQGIRPSNLSIVAHDLNRHDFSIPLPPDLVVTDIPLVGDRNEGVTLVVRNNAAKAVDLVIHASPITREQWKTISARAAQGGRA